MPVPRFRRFWAVAAINGWSRRREPGVLVELGVVEQRYRAVLEVLDEGVSVTAVARRSCCSVFHLGGRVAEGAESVALSVVMD